MGRNALFSLVNSSQTLLRRKLCLIPRVCVCVCVCIRHDVRNLFFMRVSMPSVNTCMHACICVDKQATNTTPIHGPDNNNHNHCEGLGALARCTELKSRASHTSMSMIHTYSTYCRSNRPRPSTHGTTQALASSS